jgi:hypothetical protein
MDFRLLRPFLEKPHDFPISYQTASFPSILQFQSTRI